MRVDRESRLASRAVMAVPLRAGPLLSAAVLASLFGVVSAQPVRAEIPPVSCAEDGPAAAAQLSAIKALVHDGNYPAAETKLRDYVRLHANCAEAHVLLGLVYYQQDRPADSLAQFSLAARIVPPGADELVIVSLDYLKLKDLADADKWMTVAVEKAPTDAMAWRYLGGIKYAENRFSEAIEAYGKCLGLTPGDVLAQDGTGRSYEGLKLDDEAIRAYRRAIAMQSGASPEYAEPYLHLGTLLLHQARADEAISSLQRAEKLDPHDAEVHEELGQAYAQRKEFDKAEQQLKKAIELSPHEAHLHWLLAAVYRKQGQTAKADEEARIFAAQLGSHSSGKVQ